MTEKSRWKSRCAASALVLFLLTNASPGQLKYDTEIYQDFRGKRDLLPDFRLVGTEPEPLVKAEDEGLRITLPKTREDNSQNVELAANFVVTGDFEITGTFELLNAEMPTDGWGVGVAISLADTHTIHKFLKIGRYMRPKTGSVFYAEYWTKGAKDGKTPSVKTAARSGQLRLVREGQKVRCQVADKIGNEFTTVFAKDDFGAEDLVHLRFVVSDGNKSKYAVDARLVDLRVRYGGGNNLARAEEPIAPANPPRSGVLVMTLLIAVAAGVALLLGCSLLFVLRRQRTKPNPDAKTIEDAALGMVAFTCWACGKNLRAKAGLTGKTLKCPRCQQAVLVSLHQEPEE